jgi:large subunit ribosomal protein L30
MSIALVRIRGSIRVNGKVLDTMHLLHLFRQNYCVVVEKTPTVLGMIERIKDYIAWGEIDDETLTLLREKRGSPDPKDKKALKPFFRLNPPRGGFERKGIKRGYAQGGALGYRGKEINALIRRMI